VAVQSLRLVVSDLESSLPLGSSSEVEVKLAGSLLCRFPFLRSSRGFLLAGLAAIVAALDISRDVRIRLFLLRKSSIGISGTSIHLDYLSNSVDALATF
jgi:hypothetical protein